MPYVIEIQDSEQEKITVTINDTKVFADNEKVNEYLSILLFNMIDNHSHSLPSLEPQLAQAVLRLFGGEVTFSEEEKEQEPEDGVQVVF